MGGWLKEELNLCFAGREKEKLFQEAQGLIRKNRTRIISRVEQATAEAILKDKKEITLTIRFFFPTEKKRCLFATL